MSIQNLSSKWEISKFDSCIKKVKSPKRPSIPKEQYQATGQFPIIDQSSEFICGWTDSTESVIDDNLPVIIFGDHTRIFKYVDFPFAAGADGTKILHPNDDILGPLFFYYALLNLDVPNKGYNRHYKYLREFSVTFPISKGEQIAIVWVLRAVQEAREARRREAALERERKAALMDFLFTHGTHGEPRQQTEIGEVPQNWLVCKLKDVANILMGQSPPGETYNTSGDGKPLINGPVEFGAEHPTPIQWTIKPTKVCKTGDILFCVRGNTTGRMNIADREYCIGRGIAAINGKPAISDTDFVRCLLEKEVLKIYQIAVSGGSTFPNIGGSQLNNYQIAVPPFPEQKEIATAIGCCKAKIATLEQEAALLEELFRAMLEELMTGRLSTLPLVEGAT